MQVNEFLLKSSMLSMKSSLPEKQSVIMCDAKEHAAGSVLRIESYTDEETGETSKFSRKLLVRNGSPQGKCH